MSKRMFSYQIVESDAFLDIPLSSQGLYFHLSMQADDYGFVSPKRVMRMIGANEDDLKVLLSKRFILGFESGVVVLKHWLINNTIRKDRSHDTTYQKEFLTLTTNEFGAYTEIAKISHFVEITTQEMSYLQQSGQEEQGSPTNGRQVVAKTSPEIRLEQNSIRHVNLERPKLHDLLNLLIAELGFSDKVKVTEGRLAKLKARLKSAEPDEIIQAARNIALDPWQQGDNPQHKRYGTIDYLLRSDEQIDNWANATPAQREKYA